MVLSETGILVNGLWMEIKDHFPYINLDEYIIMPDHIHGIIIINSKNASKSDYFSSETPMLGVSGNNVSKKNTLFTMLNKKAPDVESQGLLIT